MSIIDDNQKEVIRLGTVHSTVFKLSLYVMPIILGYFVTMVLRHDTELAIIKDRLAMRAEVAKHPKLAAKSQEADE